MAQKKWLVVFKHTGSSKADELVAQFDEEWQANQDANRLNQRWMDPEFGKYVVTR